MTTSHEDRCAFFAALAIYDRPENELHQKCLPGDTDVDAFLDEAIPRLWWAPPA